jgi:hypothetical protein
VTSLVSLAFIELLAYVIIGFASFLAIGTVVFLAAISLWERADEWRVMNRARKACDANER